MCTFLIYPSSYASNWRLIKTNDFDKSLWIIKNSNKELHIFKKIDVDLKSKDHLLSKWCNRVNGKLIKNVFCKSNSNIITVFKKEGHKSAYNVIFIKKNNSSMKEISEIIEKFAHEFKS